MMVDRFVWCLSSFRLSSFLMPRGPSCGEKHVDTLKMLWLYAAALYEDDCATLDDLRKSVETLGSVAPLWTRVFGPSHPDTPCVQRALEDARKALAIRTAASSSGAA